jgi:hypothetical protein
MYSGASKTGPGESDILVRFKENSVQKYEKRTKFALSITIREPSFSRNLDARNCVPMPE